MGILFLVSEVIEREIQVLELVAEGKTTKKIARFREKGWNK